MIIKDQMPKMNADKLTRIWKERKEEIEDAMRWEEEEKGD